MSTDRAEHAQIIENAIAMFYADPTKDYTELAEYLVDRFLSKRPLTEIAIAEAYRCGYEAGLAQVEQYDFAYWLAGLALTHMPARAKREMIKKLQKSENSCLHRTLLGYNWNRKQQ